MGLIANQIHEITSTVGSWTFRQNDEYNSRQINPYNHAALDKGFIRYRLRTMIPAAIFIGEKISSCGDVVGRIGRRSVVHSNVDR